MEKVQLFEGTWYRSPYSTHSKTFYVYGELSKTKRLRMHRVILNLGIDYEAGSLEPDHKDGNGLNNKRDNLQLLTRQDNIFKRPLFHNNTSGTRGVNYNKHASKWEATITINYKRIYLGKFRSKDRAIAARLAAESKYKNGNKDSNSSNTKTSSKN